MHRITGRRPKSGKWDDQIAEGGGLEKSQKWV